MRGGQTSYPRNTPTTFLDPFNWTKRRLSMYFISIFVSFARRTFLSSGWVALGIVEAEDESSREYQVDAKIGGVSRIMIVTGSHGNAPGAFWFLLSPFFSYHCLLLHVSNCREIINPRLLPWEYEYLIAFIDRMRLIKPREERNDQNHQEGRSATQWIAS